MCAARLIPCQAFVWQHMGRPFGGLALWPWSAWSCLLAIFWACWIFQPIRRVAYVMSGRPSHGRPSTADSVLLPPPIRRPFTKRYQPKNWPQSRLQAARDQANAKAEASKHAADKRIGVSRLPSPVGLKEFLNATYPPPKPKKSMLLSHTVSIPQRSETLPKIGNQPDRPPKSAFFHYEADPPDAWVLKLYAKAGLEFAPRQAEVEKCRRACLGKGTIS